MLIFREVCSNTNTYKQSSLLAHIVERRKVIQHGPSTHIISLPAEWVKKNNIQKGDDLVVEQNGWELLVSTNARAPELEIEQDVSKLTPYLVTRLLARDYQKGYDEIKLVHNDPEILGAIKDKVQDLMGFEIIEQDDEMCLIQTVTRSLEIDFDNSLRKAFLIVKQMIETCIDAYDAEDDQKLRNLKLKDMEVNRFTYFCLRQINKERHADPSLRHQSYVLYYLVETLEDLGDAMVALAANLAAALPPNDDIKDLLKEIQKQYGLSYDFFYEPSAQKAKDAFACYAKIGQAIEDLCEKDLSKHEALAVMDLKDVAEKVYHYTTMRLDLIKS